MRFLLAASAAWILTGGTAFSQDSLPDHAKKVSFRPELGANVPLEAAFRDDTGERVTLRECLIPGKPAILVFVYFECPRLCNLVLNGLVKALKTLSFEPGKDYSLIAISIDPEETPELAAEKKKSYLAFFKPKEYRTGWHFLTGEPQAIESASASAGFRYAKDPETGEFAHAAGIVVLTPRGKISRVHYGVEFSPSELKLSLVEASNESIGSVVDHILLLCYRYDPSTGKYSLAILNVVRLGGVLTVLALGSFIGTMLLKNRRRGKAVEG